MPTQFFQTTMTGGYTMSPDTAGEDISGNEARVEGGSTIKELFRARGAFLNTFFDSITQIFFQLYPGYSGNGITVKIWYVTSVTSGTVQPIDVAIRRYQDDAEVFSASHSYSYQSFTPSLPSAVAEVKSATLNFSDGAQMDNLAAGEWAHLIWKQDQHATNEVINVIAIAILEQDGA